MNHILQYLQGHDSYRTFARRGFIYLALQTLLTAIILFSYIYASPAIGIMNAEGWIYLAVASIGQAFTFTLAAYLIYLLTGLTTLRRPAGWIMVTLCSLLVIFLVLNRQVYAIYRFHINGFILNMITGPGAGNIFVLDAWMLVTEILLLAIFAALSILLYRVAGILVRKFRRLYIWPTAIALTLCLLGGHLYHAYGAFVRHAPVTRAAASLPYFYPLTAKSLLTSMGVKAPEPSAIDALEAASGEANFPLEELTAHTPDSLPDIYLILLDSWNSRGLDSITMPNAWKFAKENTRFTEHLSSSNGTRCSVFGIFYGVPGYYWESFESAGMTPPLVNRLQELGYKIQTYPSANLTNPDFRTLIFRNVPGINLGESEPTIYASDSLLTQRFLADMPRRGKEPGFSFLFYDLPHAIDLPPHRNHPFKPAWAYADYTRLNNDLDPTEFWNLYRNCLYQDDQLLGKVFDAIAKRETETGRRALVILTGDHSQEFNENHHNYWGHSGNYSKAQIKVPLAIRFPEGTHRGETFTHRTTHYDFSPTILSRYLGIDSKPEIYSFGHDITNAAADRRWHITGANLDYAFITPGDTILQKTGSGEMLVFDPKMNPVENYNVNPAEIQKVMSKLNMFYK